MVIKTISAWEARRNFGKLMDEVARTNSTVIIESHGEAKVGLVPVQLIERWARERELFFSAWREIAEAADVPEDESDRIIAEEIAAVRAERRTPKAS